MVDPRTPVLVGAGQTQQRTDPGRAVPPIDLLEEAAARAFDDSHARLALRDRVDTVGVVEITTWKYPDPGALVSRRLGIAPGRTVVTTTGGNSPQLLLNEMAGRIQAGAADVVLVGGAECMYTRWRARREPRVHLEWDGGDDPPCPTVLGDDRPGTDQHEMAHLLLAPTHVYPLFETALRHAAGRSYDEHQVHVSELWATFAAVAAGNPHAWSREPLTALDIRTVGPDNRLVCAPYTKRMCSNIDVDQAAALVLCSYATARTSGVPDDRMVFLHAGADVHEHWWVSERWSLAESPAIGIAVRAALEAAGTGLDDVARFDLYSCFPAAVQLALGSIGLAGPTAGDPRPLTVTGGLGFAGGPVNNYPTHAVAAMAERLRDDPGSWGVTTALGWYSTKHSAGVWSTRPPEAGFRRAATAALQAQVDALPRRVPALAYDGPITLEATSVPVERDGTPQVAIVAGLAPDGRRVLANSRDRALLDSMVAEAWEGRTVGVRSDGTTNEVEAT